jgi:hypothetical protein
MALRESIVQVVHHVHAFMLQPFVHHTSAIAIAITMTKASSVLRDSAQVCRAMHPSALREAIAHVTTITTRVATVSAHRVVMASAHREAMASVHSRVATVVHSRVAMVVHSRVAMVVHSRAATVSVLSRVVMVVLSRVATVVLSRVATVVLSRVAMANLMVQLPIRRLHASVQPTMIQMQSTL